jgi:xanthine dehydrogenase YagR molybdenum-binding subunit
MAIGSPTLTNTMGIVDANAIYNATGVRVRDYPITLDKFLDRLPDVL